MRVGVCAMVHRGYVKNGTIRTEENVSLPEGAIVYIQVAAEGDSPCSEGPSFAERFAAVMGKARDLSQDAAENHDHYLYGAPSSSLHPAGPARSH